MWTAYAAKSLVAMLAAFWPLAGAAQDAPVRVASTTSLVDTGLLPTILRQLESDTGIHAVVVGLPTGRALAAAGRGDADVIIVNDAVALRGFVQTNGGEPLAILENDFLIAGPPDDPAAIGGADSAAGAFTAIARVRADFVSRGDDSGTHAAEMRIWHDAGVNPKSRSGNWYRETGLGMGETIDIATRLGAYVFTDRGTWLSRRNTTALVQLFDKPSQLRNVYFAMVTADSATPDAANAARTLMSWLSGAAGRAAVDEFRLDGDRPFHAVGAAPISP